MISGGYILQPRKIDESAISKAPPHVREIWLYLLRKANHSEQKISGTVIKRGELFTSYSEIISDLSWFIGFRKEGYKYHHCETAMKTMTKAAMITARKTTRGMIITICNYDYYQDPKNYETDDDNRNDSDMITASSPHYKQECKNVKNTKENKEMFKEKKEALEERRLAFKKTLQPYSEEFTQTTVDAFFNYWSEASGKKMRWEMEKVFEIKRRLATWKSREKKSTESYNPKNLF